MLRDYLLVEPGDLATISDKSSSSSSSMTCCNASIARPKTLIPVKSLDILHDKVIAPKPSASKGFELSCNALDQSTGLYVYAKSETEDGAWECRQFPRASGYPEDPATGIAAAALACHLYQHQEIDIPAYKMYQGTAMGKPSLIVVDELNMRKVDHDMTQASFRLLGRVEIDERESMEIREDL
jgi:predicted PhzF superfamily epimerase YddE/YHI9